MLSSGNSEAKKIKIAEFSRWVLDVGDEKLENIHPYEKFSSPDIMIPRQYI